jgi:hypothetical protein
MVKYLSFVSGGMVVSADKVERSHFGGMCNLINGGVRVASIDMDLSRLKVLHLYKDDKYINVTYSVYYK